MKTYYRNQALLADPDAGSYLETRARTPYFEAMASSYAFGPKFGRLGADAVIEGLKGKPEDKDAKPAYDNIMDVYHAFTEELRTDYLRQKLEENGWSEEAERQYSAGLKAAHRRTVDAFDRVWNMENHGQYDQYLSNPLDELLGKEKGHDRCPTAEVGVIRGEQGSGL